MATQNLLADGTGAATSATVSVPANGTLSIIADGRQTGATELWRCEVDYLMSDAVWTMVGHVDNYKKTTVLFGEGDYRVRRVSGRCIVDGAF